MATKMFAASLLSCALGYAPPVRHEPVPTAWVQSSCILLSFASISGLFHLPGSTLPLHFYSCGNSDCPAPLSLAKSLVAFGDSRRGRASQRQWPRPRLPVWTVLCFAAPRVLNSGLQWQPHFSLGRLVSGSTEKGPSIGFWALPLLP